MDVVDAEQARIAEDAGAAAVMALERVPADIRRDGGVARMSDPAMIKGIQEAVTIPVMAKARIGHFAEAQVLEALEVDYIDESEVLTPGRRGAPHRQVGVHGPVRVRRDEPRRGAAAHRRGRGDDPLQGRGRHRRHRRGRPPHARDHRRDPAPGDARRAELATAAKELQAPLDLVRARRAARASCRCRCSAPAASRRPPTPSLMMQLGAEAVFVGSGIFKSEDPERRARGDRRGDDALRRPRARRRARPRASATAMVSLEARKLERRAAARQPRLVSAAGAAAIGVLALQGGFAAHARDAARARRRRARGARAGRPRRARRARHARRRVDDDDARDRARGARRAAARRSRAPGTPVLGTCAGLIMLDRDAPRACMDIDARRNAFGRQVHSFEADLEIDGLDGGRCARSSSARRGSPRRGRGRDPRGGRRPPGRRPPGQPARVSFHPELGDDTRLHEQFLAGVPRREGRARGRVRGHAAMRSLPSGSSRTPCGSTRGVEDVA